MFKAQRYLTAGLITTGLLVVTPAASAAHQDVYRDYRGFEVRAYDTGVREGLAQGEQDARLGREFSFTRSQDYRDADAGYRRGDGDLSDYRRAFRRGFEEGYAQGFERMMRDSRYMVPRATEPPYVPPYAVTTRISELSPAAQIGFKDGFDAGRKDARERESFDPVRSDRYRSGDHEYDRRYGSRDEFKREYRIGFEQGYAQGYGRERH